MNKDAKSLAGVEHREWHNLYGMYMQQATAEGLLKRNPEQDKRPFVHRLQMAVVRDAHGAPEFLKATSTDVQRLGPLVALQKTLDDLTLQ